MNASDAAAEFHQRTKHTWQRLRAEAHGLDWGNHPFPFKIYPDLEPLPLPRELPESSLPATQVLSVPVSAPASALDLAGLARLLFYSAGVTRILHGVLFRAAPSAGALYPTELYAVCGPLPGLPAGVYHFEPAEFALRRLRAGDFRAGLAAAAAAPAIARLPLCLVLTGIPWRTTWKYGERGYRHLFWDAGAIVANLLAVAAAAGWDARVLVGFVDQEITGLLGIDEPEEYPLGLVTVAAPTAATPTGSPLLGPISPRTRPLSRSPRSFPLGAGAQRAGELPSAEAVGAWRTQASRLRAQPATQTLAAGEAGQARAATDTIETVILRRGSTRRFTRHPIPQGALGWAMAAATRAVPGDFVAPQATLLEHFLAVHAVKGLPRGPTGGARASSSCFGPGRSGAAPGRCAWGRTWAAMRPRPSFTARSWRRSWRSWARVAIGPPSWRAASPPSGCSWRRSRSASAPPGSPSWTTTSRRSSTPGPPRCSPSRWASLPIGHGQAGAPPSCHTLA